VHVKMMRTLAPRWGTSLTWNVASLTAHVERLVADCTLIFSRVPSPHRNCVERSYSDFHLKTKRTCRRRRKERDLKLKLLLEYLGRFNNDGRSISHNLTGCRSDIRCNESRTNDCIRIQLRSVLPHAIESFLA